jgi:hypothetical protein
VQYLSRYLFGWLVRGFRIATTEGGLSWWAAPKDVPGLALSMAAWCDLVTMVSGSVPDLSPPNGTELSSRAWWSSSDEPHRGRLMLLLDVTTVAGVPCVA